MINPILYPEVRSLHPSPSKLVVFLHGLGSDGHDLISLVPFIQPELPECHFISPHGVEAFDMAPFGRQWCSFSDRTPALLKRLVKKNVSLVADIIKAKQTELNLANKDTVLIGFSQGTIFALYLNLIQKQPFHSVVGFSGMLIAPDEPINKTTPICLIHGQADELVKIEEFFKIEKYLTNQNIPHTTHVIPYLAHSIDAKGIKYAIDFIKSKF